MVLDNEKQKQLLVQMIENFNVSGTVTQMTNIISEMLKLRQAVIDAKVEDTNGNGVGEA